MKFVFSLIIFLFSMKQLKINEICFFSINIFNLLKKIIYLFQSYYENI